MSKPEVIRIERARTDGWRDAMRNKPKSQPDNEYASYYEQGYRWGEHKLAYQRRQTKTPA